MRAIIIDERPHGDAGRAGNGEPEERVYLLKYIIRAFGRPTKH